MLTEAQCVHIDFILFVTLFNIVERCCVYAVEHRAQSGSVCLPPRAVYALKSCCANDSETKMKQRKDYCYCYHLPLLVYLFYSCVKMKTQMWGKHKISMKERRWEAREEKKICNAFESEQCRRRWQNSRHTRARARWNRISGEREKKITQTRSGRPK